MARATASCSGPTRALSTSDGRRLGEQRRFGPYRTAVGFTSRWGTAEPAGHLNGSSGRWVEDQILAPLGLARDEVWITDCLNTYHRSTEVHVRIQRTYNPFATGEGLSVARLAQHPTEEDIVAEAVAERDRLLEELETAQPELIITAGRAALRVMEALVRVAGERPSLRVRPGGPMLRVSRLEWQHFVDGARRGEFELPAHVSKDRAA